VEDAELSEVCVCGHERRTHMAHGRAGAYDTCLAMHKGQEGNVGPCLLCLKAASKP
jgi:hypothetical protein